MKYLVILGMLLVSGCGYEQLGVNTAGQVKKVIVNNPIICSAYTAVDLSLGVMRNGVGSMSTEDVYLTVVNTSDVQLLNKAVETGRLVKITYDTKRWTWCTYNKIVSKVELTQ